MDFLSYKGEVPEAVINKVHEVNHDYQKIFRNFNYYDSLDGDTDIELFYRFINRLPFLYQMNFYNQTGFRFPLRVKNYDIAIIYSSEYQLDEHIWIHKNKRYYNNKRDLFFSTSFIDKEQNVFFEIDSNQLKPVGILNPYSNYKNNLRSKEWNRYSEYTFEHICLLLYYLTSERCLTSKEGYENSFISFGRKGHPGIFYTDDKSVCCIDNEFRTGRHTSYIIFKNREEEKIIKNLLSHEIYKRFSK